MRWACILGAVCWLAIMAGLFHLGLFSHNCPASPAPEVHLNPTTHQWQRVDGKAGMARFDTYGDEGVVR